MPNYDGHLVFSPPLFPVLRSLVPAYLCRSKRCNNQLSPGVVVVPPRQLPNVSFKNVSYMISYFVSLVNSGTDVICCRFSCISTRRLSRRETRWTRTPPSCRTRKSASPRRSDGTVHSYLQFPPPFSVAMPELKDSRDCRDSRGSPSILAIALNLKYQWNKGEVAQGVVSEWIHYRHLCATKNNV